MNILFVIKNIAHLRTLAPVVAALDGRGHRIALVCKDVKSRDSNEQLQRLVGGSAGISIVEPPFARIPGWSDLAASLRKTIDLSILRAALRHGQATAGAEQEAPRRRASSASQASSAGSPSCVERCLDAAQARLVPQKQAPDVLVITAHRPAQQADTVQAAQRLGIPVMFPVRSWDNLHEQGAAARCAQRRPRLVWPAEGGGRAAHVPATRQVVVTGAPADHWFDWPWRTEVLRKVGLDRIGRQSGASPRRSSSLRTRRRSCALGRGRAGTWAYCAM